ncbi:MAG TPA: GntR family transcriptional regulator [Victivallales bacterium]|nr:GntR family transcriptional regulator [Victivallales bacterium]
MSLKNKLVEQLKNDIIRGLLKPGEQLKILELKKIYKSGGTPLREALNELVGTHLVNKKETCGFIVAPISLDDLQDIYFSKIFVEKKLASDSIKNGNEEWELGIVSSYYTLSKIEKNKIFADSINFEEWDKKLGAFKSSIYCKANLRKIIYFYHWLDKQQQRYRYLWFEHYKNDKKKINISAVFHLKLKDAVLERNEEKTHKIITDHTSFLIESLSQLI